MKKTIAFLSLGFVLILASCEKNNNDSETLEGQWELRRASGMITINYPPGEGQTIKFKGNNYEIRNKNGQITQSGEYSVVADAGVSASTCLVIPDGEYTKSIDFNNDHPSRKVYLQLSNDSLFFLSGCFALDGGSKEEYVRK